MGSKRSFILSILILSNILEIYIFLHHHNGYKTYQRHGSFYQISDQWLIDVRRDNNVACSFISQDSIYI